MNSVNKIIINEEEIDLTLFKDYPDVVNVKQMSKMLNICTASAYALLKENAISYFKIGNCYRIPKVNILRYINLT